MRRRRIVVIGLVVGAVVVALWVGLSPSGPKEPEYGGRSFTQWLGLLETPRNDEAEAALQQIGTNAVPCLIGWMRYEPSAATRGITRILRILPVRVPSTRLTSIIIGSEREARAHAAPSFFSYLGPDATNCIPELTRIMNDRRSFEVSTRAIIALACLGKDSLPPMLAALSDPTHPDRVFLAEWVCEIRDLGTNGAPAVPVLIECLRDRDENVAAQAARSLGELRLAPSLAVPALIGGLSHTNYLVRVQSANSLEDFGEDARGAVPAIIVALDDPQGLVQNAASDALEKIAPEEYKKDKETRKHKEPLVPGLRVIRAKH